MSGGNVMNISTPAIWILIVGVSLVAPSSVTASSNQQHISSESRGENEHEETEKDKDLETQRGKTGKPVIDSSKETPTIPVDMPVYRPPLRGAPKGRVGGGTRGPGKNELPFLAVAAPNHLGLTMQKQPRLYWFLSKLTTYPIEFTLTEYGAVKPLIEERVKSPEKAGLQCVRLADYGIELRWDVQYKWFVAIIMDPARRSKDILAGGMIECITQPDSLHVRLEKAGEDRAPHIYAEAGLWYDAFTAISDLIEKSPTNSALRRMRASLLEQVGLREIAQDEMMSVNRARE